MKITLSHIVEHGSISAAIEALCKESDTVASGVIGSSFACSGPGSGYQRNYDVTDYAKRALSGDYGALSYIDSSDGREGELDDDGDVEWSDESVVEIELPSVEEALESPIAWGVIRASAADYGVAQDDIDDLDCQVATPYMVRDSAGVTERASTLEELAGIIEDWYDHLLDDGKLEVMPDPGLDSSSLEALESSTRDWENRIAEAMGYTEFAGRGSYRVSAASEAALCLTIGLRD